MYRRSLAGALLVLGAVTACADNSSVTLPSPTPTSPSQTPSPSPSAKPLVFRVIGQCTTKAGTLTSFSRGFTPGGAYTTEATGPDGKPYVDIDNPGDASSIGDTPRWKWPCQGPNDLPGEYKIKVTDNATGRFVTTTLTVGAP